MNTRKKAQERATPAGDAGGGEGEEKPALPMTVSVGLGVSMSVGGVGVSMGVGVSPLPGTPDLLAATTGTTTTAMMTSTSTTPAVLESPSVGAARVTPRLGGLGSKRSSEAPEKGGTVTANKRRAIPMNTASIVTHLTNVSEAPIPRPAAPLSRLAEYAAVSEQPSPQQQDVSPQQDSGLQDDPYVFLIKPLMGSPFTITLSRDSSLFDLKDAIFAKVGITPDMQSLAVMDQYQPPPPLWQQQRGKTYAVNFDNEEQFLEDLALPRLCTLYLSVRATTGQQVLNDIYLGEDELFVYDILPVVGGAQDKNIAGPVGDGDASVENTTTNAPAANDTSSDEPSAVDADTNADVRVTVPMSSLPLPVLQSYLLHSAQEPEGADEDEDEDDADYDRDGHQEFEGQPQREQLSLHVADGLESLRITIRDDDLDEDEGRNLALCSIPPRPATPFPNAPHNDHRQQQATMVEEQTKPAPSAGPTRCGKCGIRCRLASQFECRCGRTFCSQHRYYDTHNCTFDHKNHDRARLASANPRVYKPTLDQL